MNTNSYFSGWDIFCAALIIGIVILGIDILIAFGITMYRFFW